MRWQTRPARPYGIRRVCPAGRRDFVDRRDGAAEGAIGAMPKTRLNLGGEAFLALGVGAAEVVAVAPQSPGDGPAPPEWPDSLETRLQEVERKLELILERLGEPGP